MPFLIRWPGTIPAVRPPMKWLRRWIATTFAAWPGKLDSNRKIDGKTSGIAPRPPGAKSPHELFVYFHQGQLHGAQREMEDAVFPRRQLAGRPAGLSISRTISAKRKTCCT